MSTKYFQFTDEQGRSFETVGYAASDFSTDRKPNAPILTRADGFIDGSLIDPLADTGIKTMTDYISLTNSNIASKKVFLSRVPASKITLIPEGGISQRDSIDYTYIIDDNSVSWADLGLDGFLEAGETLEVSYFYR